MKIFSGIQPSGTIHIGNYLGAIKRFVELEKDNELMVSIVDLHAITVPQEPAALRDQTLDVAATYLAAGLDPDKTIIFVQSHIPAHAELGWILNTMTPLGELERMTQFKDKSRAQGAKAGVMAGLFNYPTLMAADILLYQTDGVPVGEDQIQHIELARSLADRFNNRFGETFKIPKPLIQKETARIMALDDPVKKMSKSAASADGYIALTDTPDEIRRKIKKAVTDSDDEIRFDPNQKPAISNLLTIFAGIADKSIEDIEAEFGGKSYAAFKEALAEIIVKTLEPFQAKFAKLRQEPEHLAQIFRSGAAKAAKLAAPTLAKVKEKIGLLV